MVPFTRHYWESVLVSPSPCLLVRYGESMSSFSNPHFMYLFALKSGKKKLAYGESPEDALNILRIRLGEQEMSEILTDQFIKINQRELQQYVGELG